MDSSQTISVAESAADNAAVGTVTTSGDTPTLFSINGGNTAGIFAISAAGAVTVLDNTNLDYDSTTSYSLTIVTSDGTTADAETVTVSVTDVNDQAPSWTTSATANVAEGATAVATLAATDTDTADSGGLTYAITTDDPGAGTQFAVSGTALTIAAQNYEAPACGAGSNSLTCVVVLSATDAANTATAHTITVTITDTNDQTPVYQAADADDTFTVAENTATNSVIDNGVITDTDTGNTLGCTLGGADSGDFTCTISGNNAQLKFAAVPN